MNFAHFAGRLGRDAELRNTPDGKTVLNFALAVDTGYGDRKETLWIDCALWGDRSEKLAQYLTKGKQVTIAGDVGLRTFEKRDGSAGASITCNVQRLTLQGGNAASEPAHQPAPAARPAAAAKPAPSSDAEFNDDIPF